MQRALRRPPAAVLVGAIVAVQVAVWAAIYGDAFFKIDDFIFFADAERSGGWTWDWLGSVYWQHLAPGHRAAWLLLGNATPGAWAALLSFQLGLLALGVVTFHAVLRLLFGASRWLLVAVAVVGLTPQLAIAFAWPSHGLMAIPEFAAQMLTLYGFLMYVHTRRARWLLLAAGGLAFGLLFYVRTLLVLGVIALVRYLLIEPSLRPRALAAAVWRDRLAWLAVGLPAVAYVAYYVGRDVFGTSVPYDSVALEQYVRILWLRNIWPRMLGVAMGAEPTAFQVFAEVLAQLLLVGAVAVTLWRKRSAWRGWTLVPAVLAPTIWMTASGRLGELGPAVGYDPRYVTHLPWVIALAVLFAFHPRRHLVLGAEWPRSGGRGWVAPAAVAAATLAVAGLSARSIADTDAGFGGAAARAYATNLVDTAREIERAAAPPRLLNGPASPTVQGGYQMTRAEIVLGTGAPIVLSDWTVPDAVLAEDGRVIPATYEAAHRVDLDSAAVRGRIAPAGTWRRSGAGWCLAAGTAPVSLTVPLDAPTPATGETFVDADMLAPATFPLALDIGDGLPAEAHRTLSAPRTGLGAVPTGVAGLHGFRIDVPAGQELCVGRLGLGVLVPRSA